MMWTNFAEKIKLPLLIVLIIVSTIYTFHGFSNLIVDSNEGLPVDLALRYANSNDLIIDKVNIYEVTRHAQYPPSTFGILALVTVPVSYSRMDDVWAVINILALILLAKILYQIPTQTIDKWLLIFSFLSFHSIAHGLGVGQITVLIVASTLAAIYLAKNWNNIFSTFIVILFLTFALGKYSLLLPFGLIFLLDRDLRIPFLGALSINLTASHFILERVNSSIPEYIQNVIGHSAGTANSGTIDIHALLSLVNIGSPYTMLGTLTLLLLFTFIIIKNRQSLNLWDQLALAAITARLFVYHAHYDNVILIFVVIALLNNYQDVKRSINPVLLSLVTLLLIVPARFVDTSFFIQASQLISFIASAVFLTLSNYRFTR